MTNPFTCPFCGAVSHNPRDAEERYCGRCHVFVDDERQKCAAINAPVDWDLVQWRAAFRAASAANDAKIEALLLELRAEQLARARG